MVEWYIDVYFLVNFSMDVLMLLLLGKILKLPVRWFRLAGAGVAGALAACLAVWFWYLPKALVWFAGILAPAGIMVWIAFRPGNVREFIKIILVFFLEAFCIGGIMEALYEHMKGSRLAEKGLPVVIWGLFAAGAWFAFRFFWLTAMETKKERQELYRLELRMGKEKVSVLGYLDTGNCLYEPKERRPVHIVSENLWKKLKRSGTETSSVPFRTIGNPLGVMEMMEIDRMEVRKDNGESRILTRPLVARAPFKITRDGSYDVLLHKETCAQIERQQNVLLK